MAEIKTAMKDGRTDAVERLMPPLDGRIKGHKRSGIIQLLKMNAHMGSVLLQISTLQSSEEMVAAMNDIARRMDGVNAKLRLPQLQRILEDFVKQNNLTYIPGSSEAAMDDDDDDGSEEGGTVTATSFTMLSLSQAANGGGYAADAAAAPDDDDENEFDAAELQSRLDNLRRS